MWSGFSCKKEYPGAGFEWKSTATLFGYLLIHIAVGKDANGKLRVARGVIAIGPIALGWYALCPRYIWSPGIKGQQAIEIFTRLWNEILSIFR